MGTGVFNSEEDSQITLINNSITTGKQGESKSSGIVNLGEHHALYNYRGIGLKSFHFSSNLVMEGVLFANITNNN